MKKDFKLQKILEYRGNILELEKKKLAQFQQKLRDLEVRKEGFISQLDEKNLELEKIKEKCDFKFVKMYEDFIVKLRFMLMQIDNMIVKAKMDYENQKKKVIDALNDKKVMEKLKDKHIKNYRLYLNKEEMKIVDDLVVSRFNRGEND